MSSAFRICGVILFFFGFGYFFYRIITAEILGALLFAAADALFILLLFAVAGLLDRVEALENQLSRRDGRKDP
jgi:hypothetical protein